jgi:hypothetical protein
MRVMNSLALAAMTMRSGDAAWNSANCSRKAW